MNKLYRWLKLSLLLVLASACAKDDAVVIDPQFLPYLAEIEEYTGDDITGSTSIEMGDAGKYAGVCTMSDSGKKITIDKRAWGRSNDNFKLLLLGHELGHCALGKDHDSSIMELNGRRMPKSIMYKNISEVSNEVNRDKDLLKYYLEGLLE